MNNIEVKDNGTIRLNSKVMISDPCYGLNTWCQGIVDNVLPGSYDCFVEYSDEGEWGIRVSAIEVRHICCDEVPRDFYPEDFEVGVDSGQAGIFDYEYYKKYHTDIKERNHVSDGWYDKVCDITLARAQAGIVDNLGLVSSSGYGDGGYTCWTARDNNDKVIAIRVEYITEDYDEYDYIEEE